MVIHLEVAIEFRALGAEQEPRELFATEKRLRSEGALLQWMLPRVYHFILGLFNR